MPKIFFTITPLFSVKDSISVVRHECVYLNERDWQVAILSIGRTDPARVSRDAGIKSTDEESEQFVRNLILTASRQ